LKAAILNMNNNFDRENISFEQVPLAIAYLINEVQELKQAISQPQSRENKDADEWMNLVQLKEYLPDKPATATIYGWVSHRSIPYHKGGKKLRFRKSEIDKWLSEGKRQSNDEIEAAAQLYLVKNRKGV
jgi:excisionase family DNA binding protein